MNLTMLPTIRQRKSPEYFHLRVATMRVADRGNEFSADDVQSAMEKASETIHSPNLLGSAVFSLAKQGYLRHIGYAKSHRKGRHGSLIRTWKKSDKPFNFKAEERAVELLRPRTGELPLIF